MIFSRNGRNNSDRCRRMVDQAEIHRKVASGDVGERKDGVEQLRSNFAEDLMPVIAPILVLSALIFLLLIIRNAKSG